MKTKPVNSSDFTLFPSARYYPSAPLRNRNSDLSIWLSVDPMVDKYPNLSPYTYCADNPVGLVDPDGRIVHPQGEEEYTMILNTLPEADRQFVKFDKDGCIDKELMNSHTSESGNYNSLLMLVNSDIVTDVILEGTQYPYMDQNGVEGMQLATYQVPWEYSVYDRDGNTISAVSSGEGGNMGLTLFPGNSIELNSTDQNIKVYVNKQLSAKGRAETFSHEGYGHALLYHINGHDANGAIHHFEQGMKEGNLKLMQLIRAAKKETINNMK